MVECLLSVYKEKTGRAQKGRRGRWAREEGKVWKRGGMGRKEERRRERERRRGNREKQLSWNWILVLRFRR